MRRAAKVDSNQTEIVEALRAIGATVQHLHMVGKGCPDLLVGYKSPRGVRRNWLLELKDGSLSPSRRKLTEDEDEWHEAWQGSVIVVKSVEEAIMYLRMYESPADVPPF